MRAVLYGAYGGKVLQYSDVRNIKSKVTRLFFCEAVFIYSRRDWRGASVIKGHKQKELRIKSDCVFVLQ